MKKKVALLLSVVLLLSSLGLAACGSETTEPAAETTETDVPQSIVKESASAIKNDIAFFNTFIILPFFRACKAKSKHCLD